MPATARRCQKHAVQCFRRGLWHILPAASGAFCAWPGRGSNPLPILENFPFSADFSVIDSFPCPVVCLQKRVEEFQLIAYARKWPLFNTFAGGGGFFRRAQNRQNRNPAARSIAVDVQNITSLYCVDDEHLQEQATNGEKQKIVSRGRR